MSAYIPEILLWLLVLNLGIAYGAGLYEQRIVLPQWFMQSAGSGLRVNSQAMRETDVGRRFWGFVTTVPLTLLTLANLAAAWQSEGPEQGWWLTTSFLILVERAGTFSFFIPEAIRLMRAETAAPSMALRWMRLNHVRNTLTLAGWLTALKTLSLIT